MAMGKFRSLILQNESDGLVAKITNDGCRIFQQAAVFLRTILV